MTNAILRGAPDVKHFASAKTRSLLHGSNSTLGSLAFLLSLFCVWPSHAAETNVWTGAGGDLKWGNAANWSKNDMTKSYVWDFRALPAGSVLEYGFASAPSVAGLVFSGSADAVWTCPAGTVTFVSPVIDVTGGRLVWKGSRGINWNEWGAATKTGNGTMVLAMTDGRFHGEMNGFNVKEGTLELDTAQSVETAISISSGAKLVLKQDALVSSLSGDSGASVELNGYTLTLRKRGVNVSAAARTYKGTVTGTGSIVFGGGETMTFTASPAYTGTTTLRNADVNAGVAGVPAPLAAVSSLDIAQGGVLTLFGSQTLAALSGSGATGGVRIPSGATLTVGTANGAETTFSGRLSGEGGFTKAGASSRLTLDGANTYAGATAVDAGTLRLRGPVNREGLTLYLDFENAAVPGEDRSAFGGGNVPPKNAALVSAGVEDGVVGKCVRFNPSTTWSDDGNMNIKPTDLNGAMPSGSNPFTCSFWFKDGGWTRVMTSFCGVRIAFRNDATLEFRIGDEFVQYKNADSGYFKNHKTEWYLVTATYADSKMALYLNGALVEEKTLASPAQFGTGQFYLGVGNPDWITFIGCIDEFQMYNRAWTAAEAKAEYDRVKAGLPFDSLADAADALPTPVAHWAFDDAANPGKDSGPNKIDLVAHGTAPAVVTTAGAKGGALNLVAKGYLGLADGASLPAAFPETGSAYTFAIRVRNSNDSGDDRGIFSWGDNVRYVQFYTADNPRDYKFRRVSASGSAYGLTDPETMGLLWQTIVCTYDPVTSKLCYYRDGVLLGTGTLAAGTATGSRQNLVVGTYVTDLTKLGTALVDDIQVFDRALSPRQVATFCRAFETGKAGEVLSADSAVTVAAGATLEVDAVQTVKSLQGSGVVAVAPKGRLTVAETANFGGTFSGSGTLTVADGATIRLGEVPFGRGAARVELPENLTFDFGADAPTAKKTFVAGGQVSAPADLSGWKAIVNGKPVRCRFDVTATAVCVKICAGLIVVVQ